MTGTGLNGIALRLGYVGSSFKMIMTQNCDLYWTRVIKSQLDLESLCIKLSSWWVNDLYLLYISGWSDSEGFPSLRKTTSPRVKNYDNLSRVFANSAVNALLGPLNAINDNNAFFFWKANKVGFLLVRCLYIKQLCSTRYLTVSFPAITREASRWRGVAKGTVEENSIPPRAHALFSIFHLRNQLINNNRVVWIDFIGWPHQGHSQVTY